MKLNTPSLHERVGGRGGLAVLLKHFYADVRQHHLIGPVFNQHIQDWPAHLARIGEFWARLAGGPSSFAGSLPFKHGPLGLASEHFDAWLGLWEHSCRCHLAPAEAMEMIQLAHMIGDRLHGLLVGERRNLPCTGSLQEPGFLHSPA